MADEMGILRTDVEIESPLREGDRRLVREVLVDTGAELSWAPAPVLESLGIARRKPIRFQQADGTFLEGLNLKGDLAGKRLVSAGPMLAPLTAV